MRTLRRAAVAALAAVFLMPAAMAFAIVLPATNLNLSTPTSSYNTLAMTVTLTSPISGSSTQHPTITGSCSTTFNALFNPANDQATIQDITFNLQNPGEIALQNVTFSYAFGLETIKTNNVMLSPFTQTPPTPTPTPVSSGVLPANQVWAEFNSGTLVYGGLSSGSADLSSSPIDGQNGSTSSGTVSVSTPTMNGNVATYTATVTIPLAISQSISGASYTAQINATGTLQSSGTFQFDFSPRTVYWNTASGDFSAGGNWDVGFAPRTVDTAAIQNGGASTLSTAFPGSPAAVWVGDGAATSGTLTLAAGGSLSCGAMVLGQSGAAGTLVLGGGTLLVPSIVQGAGGSGTLYFDGGTLQAAASNSQFLAGLSAAYLRSGGATINTNGFAVAISQPLGHDPALGATADGGLLKTGGGALALLGVNTYSGPTTITAGTLQAGAASALSPGSDLAVTGGALNVTGFAQTIKSLTVGAAGLDLGIGYPLTSSGSASLSGALNLSGAGGGNQDLISYLSYSGSFSSVSGVPAGYALKYTASQLDLIAIGSLNNSILGASTSSVSLGRVMLDNVPTANVTIGLTSGTSASGFSASAANGATATVINNVPGAITTSQSGSVAVSLTNATGSYSGTVQVQNSGDDGTGNGPSSAGPGQGNAQSPIVISVTGTVVDNRVVTSTSASFGLVHLGTSLSQGITLSTSGIDSQYTRVTVANGGTDSNGFLTVSGGSNLTFNGPSATENRTLFGTASTPGAFNGSVILTTNGEGLAGESPINVPVNYSVQVFSGSGNWAGSSSSWAAKGNWTDSNGSGVQAAPGTFAGFTNTDVANFNGFGSVTAIDLTGVNPSLNALSFSNSSYTLSNGSLTLYGSTGMASVTVSNGTQSINTPMTLATNASFAINSGALMLNSTISGSRGFTKIGNGALTMAGGNTYTGATTIAGGMLVAGASNALSESSGLTINGGTLDASGFANTVASLNVASSGCLNLALGNTLTSNGIAALNGTLNVSATGTLGNYRLLTYASQTGAFVSATGLDPNYGLFYNTNGTELDALHKAQVGILTVTAVNPTVIAGGTTALIVDVTNSAPSQSDTLNLTASASGAGYGLSTTGSLAAASSGSFAIANGFNGTLLSPGSYMGIVTLTGTNSALNGPALNSGGTASVMVNVLGHSRPSLTVASGNNQTVIVGATGISAGLSLSNGILGQSGLASLDVNSLGFGVSGSTGAALVASGSAESYTAVLNTGTVGTQVETFSMNVGDDRTLPGASAPINLSTSASLTVLDHAAGSTTVTSGNGLLVHAGTAVVSATVSLNNAAGTRSNLEVDSAPTIGSGTLSSGPATPYYISAGSAQPYAATFKAPVAPGAFSDTVTFASVGDKQSLPGANPPGSLSVSITGNVYSGKAQWNATTGLWAAAADWTDTVGGGPSGPPGLSGYATDTATFGSAVSMGTAVVALDGVAPVLSNLIFNNPNSSYWILQGVGTTGLTLTGTDSSSPAVVTVISGTHLVEAPILFSSNLVVNSSGSLTLSGSLSDAGLAKSLTLDGGGELILSGTGSYSGGTVVTAGRLVVTSAEALADGTSLTVGGTAAFDLPAAAVPISLPPPAPMVKAVPEPAGLTLLAAAAVGLLGFARRRRRV